MNMHKHNIDNIINSLQGAGRAEPRPYLLTRINATIADNQAAGLWSRLIMMLQKPVVAFTLIGVITLFNLSFFLLKKDITDTAALIQKAGKNEFAINVSSIYDLENSDQ